MGIGSYCKRHLRSLTAPRSAVYSRNESASAAVNTEPTAAIVNTNSAPAAVNTNSTTESTTGIAQAESLLTSNAIIVKEPDDDEEIEQLSRFFAII